MKILAVLTMCFLPGTFVATLFSMTVFDSDANGNTNSTQEQQQQQQQQTGVVSSKFWVYWAIAVPLTLLTFTICAAWLMFERVRQRKQNRDAELSLEDGLAGSEVKALVMRRSATGTLSKFTAST